MFFSIYYNKYIIFIIMDKLFLLIKSMNFNKEFSFLNQAVVSTIVNFSIIVFFIGR